MGLDNVNDSAVKDLKVFLCDFFCEKIKNIVSIEDDEEKEEYIECLVKAAEGADNLTDSFEQFENFSVVTSEKKDVQKEVKAGEVIEKKTTLPTVKNEAVKEKSVGTAAKNEEIKGGVPLKVDDISKRKESAQSNKPVKEEISNGSIKSILPESKPSVGSGLAPTIKIEASSLPKIPNIFEGIFNNNEDKKTEETKVDSTSKQSVEETAGGEKEEKKPEVGNNSEVGENNATNNLNGEIDYHNVVTPVIKAEEVIPTSTVIPNVPEDVTSNATNDNILSIPVPRPSDNNVSPLVAAYSHNAPAPVAQTSAVSSNEVMQIRKLSEDRAKAILVNKEQIGKLGNSLAQQKILLGFEQVQSFSNQMEIEAMMNKAGELYREGKKDEAQELYNKISEMNKANVLVKKVA